MMPDDNTTYSPDEPEDGSPRESNWLAPILLRSPAALLWRLKQYRQKLRHLSTQKRRWLMRRAAVTVAGAALLLALSRAPAMPDVITVANGEVAVADNGKCSLIEAIENANDTKNGRPYNDCAAGNPTGADTINLPKNGEFVLVETAISGDLGSSGTPWIRTSMTINGNGSIIRRADGAPQFRIMQVGRKGDLTLRDTYIRDGDSDSEYYGGAGIYIQGEATLENVHLENNISYVSFSYVCGAAISNSGNLKIEQSTISGNEAACGAGIDNSGSLTIVGSVIDDNYAYSGLAAWGSGIFNRGTLTMSRTTVSKNRVFGHFSSTGAGIDNFGTATIVESIISGNSVFVENDSSWAGGGGIASSGDLFIQSTTVEDNLINGTYSNGGGLFNSGKAIVDTSMFSGNIALATYYGNEYGNSGGGVANAGDLTISNSTLSGNQTPYFGGGMLNLSKASLVNVTISRNLGGGLHTYCYYKSASTWLSRTIVSGNIGSNEAHVSFHKDSVACPDPMVVDVSNIFGVSGNAGVNFPLGPSDIVPEVGLGSILAPLADNGGPTLTHALVPGSPAIDRARSVACAGQTDQRGYVRNADGNGVASSRECDIGAFEFNAAAPTPSPTATTAPSATATSTPRPTNTSSPTPSTTPTGTVTPPVDTPVPTETPPPTGTSAPSPTPTVTATRPSNLDYTIFLPLARSDVPYLPRR